MTAALTIAWVALVVHVGWATRPLPRGVLPGHSPARGRDVVAVIARRRAQRVAAAAVASELPDVIDLFVLATGAGLNVTLALAAVASRSPPHWHPALRAAVDGVHLGERLGDALAGLPAALGDGARPLASVLAASARYGTPLLPALDRLAVEARADRRRRAEEAARRLPVTLLFPLVLCVLPAFGLLTLAPALAGAVQTLGL